MIISYTYYFIILLIISLLFDFIIGELPILIHPVVMIGAVIDFLINHLIKFKNKLSGFILTLLTFCVCIFVFFIFYYFILVLNLYFYSILSNLFFILIVGILLSSLYSVNMLINATLDVKRDLNVSLDTARKSMSYLVSRDTSSLSSEFIISASIETMTENITDSYVSSIFFYFLFLFISLFIGFNFYDSIFFSILGVLIHRIVNTLDAMVGYKNDKFLFLGWFPANLDDILNFIPARFAGLMVVLSSFILNLDYKNSFKIMLRDGSSTPSPNSGFTMSAIAGALNIQLEKKDTYILGDKLKVLDKGDIDIAVRLTFLSIILSTFVLIILFILLCGLF